MSKQSHIDGIRLYSDNLEGNSKTTKKVEYKKVSTTTTTKTITKGGKQTSQKTETTIKINKDYGLPKSKNMALGQIKETRSASTGQKDKFSYAGKLKEKQNYLYYVSGIGFVDKDGKQVKQDNKPKETKVIKNPPKPTRPIGPRITITIQNKRPERKGGELVENYEYHETKNFGDHNRESIVVHRRLGDPFYQSIYGKRSSTYTPGIRGKSNYTLEKEESKTVTDYSKIKTKTVTTDYRIKKTSENRTIDTSKYAKGSSNYQKNQYQNKTYNTTKSTQTNKTNQSNNTSQSGYNKGTSNYNSSSYQRTINVEERKRNIVPKTQFEKTLTETNARRNAAPVQKKYIPSTKKYQEKSEDSYSRKNNNQNQPKNQYNANLSKKVFDTEKYKRKVEPSKYQQKTEETYKSKMTDYSQKGQDGQDGQEGQQGIGGKYGKNGYDKNMNGKENNMAGDEDINNVGENNDMNNDPNYCPIHGYHGHASGEQDQENMFNQQIENAQDQGNMNVDNNGEINYEEIDNYKFYESKCFSNKTHNVNTNININTQKVINTEENINISNTANNMNNMGVINMGNMEAQDQMIQSEEGYDLSKLYIATRVIPVYSDMIGNTYQCGHVCNVCGNPFDDNMIQQNNMNEMQAMAIDSNCPIHGQNLMEQQQ